MQRDNFFYGLILGLLYLSLQIIIMPMAYAQSPLLDFQLPVPFEAGSQYPDDMAIADLNGDGHLDVAVLAANRVHFLLGDGNGALEKDGSLPVGDYSKIAFGDFNNDGLMDFVVSKPRPAYASTVACSMPIYLGTGGNFVADFVLKRCLSNIWGAIAIVDYNDDGILDIVGQEVAFSAHLGDGLVLGIGDGTFSDSQRINLNDAAVELAQEINQQWSDLYSLGDLNADGVNDTIGVSTAGGGSLRVTLANKLPIVFDEYLLPDTPTAVAVADINNDANLDVLVRTVNSSDLLIFPGAGDGQLLEPFTVAAAPTNSRLRANEVLISDFNEDGWRDLAAVDYVFEQDSNLWRMLQIPGNKLDKIAPTLTITAPSDGDKLANTVAFTVNAEDNFGITYVDFFQNNTLISSSAGPVFTSSWDTLGVVDGDYVLSATAFDGAGNSSEMAINVKVDNSSPTFTSIPSQNSEAVVGLSYSYHAVTTGVQPIDYELIVSPNGMTISSNGIIDWTPTPEQLGVQTITIRASNGFGSAEQTYSVNVVDKTAPSIPEGLGIIEFVDANSVKLGWAPSTDDVGVAGYRLYRYYYSNRWNKGYRAVGDFTSLSAVVDRWIYIYAHRQQSAASYKISAFDDAGNVSPQSAAIRVEADTAPTIYHNNRYSGDGVSYYGLDGTAFYHAVVGQLLSHVIGITGLPTPTLSLIGAPSGMVLNGQYVEWVPQPGQEGVGSVIVRATNSLGSADYTLNYHVYASQVANNSPVASASATPFDITLPDNTFSLNGSASDDGLPNNSLTYSWSVNGTAPGPVTFSNANSANTEVSVTTAGNYFFKLTVSDGELSGTAYASVLVRQQPVNTPPYISGISNKEITLPLDHVNLSTYVSKESLNFAWTKVSGPGLVTYSNGSGLFSPGYVLGLPRMSTDAYFSTSGVYEIQLTITDLGGLSSSTTVQVTVNPPAPTNTAPITNAGPDQSLTFPEQTLTLNGSAVDDGLPAIPGTLSYNWSLVSGIESVSFANASSAITDVTFFEAGSYVLRLTASDGVLSHDDDVLITVLPATNHPDTPPQVDPNAETAEFEGQISEVGASFIVVNGEKIWYSNSTILKFGDGTNGEFAVGQSAQVKAKPNLDGSSLTGIKIEVES